MTTQAERKKTERQIKTNGIGLYLPQRWLWTVKEFQRAYDLGAFGFDTRLELIEGEIIRKMSQNEPHTWAIRAVEETLRNVFMPGHDVRVQLPLVFGLRSKPEPDIAVIVGSFNDYKHKHPSTAVLAVEVSDNTRLRPDDQSRTLCTGRDRRVLDHQLAGRSLGSSSPACGDGRSAAWSSLS